jgi:pyruvate-formate lyase
LLFLKGDKVMDKDVKITPEQLAKATDADYQKLVQLLSGGSLRGHVA